MSSFKGSVDNTTKCRYRGRVCGTKALRYEHEKACSKNPQQKSDEYEGKNGER